MASARDLEAALVAVGEAVREAAGEPVDADVFEQGVRLLGAGALLGAAGTGAGEHAPQPGAGMAVAGGHDVLQRAQLAEQASVLEGAGDAARYHRLRPRRGQGRAVEQELAGVGWVDASERVEEAGLACAVWADEAVDLALEDGQRDAGERLQAAEALVDGAGFEQEGHRQCRGYRSTFMSWLAAVLVAAWL